MIKYFLIFLILSIGFSVIFFQSVFAYHEEREQIEMSQETGLFTPDMTLTHFPRINKEYHLQVVLHENEKYENSAVNVGYALNLLEKIPHRYSLDDSIKDIKGFEKIRQLSHVGDSKRIQTSQYVFPILVNFTVTFDKPGFYQYQFFQNRENGGGSSSGEYQIVSNYSKALNENGICKNAELSPLPKHDFSILVCATTHTIHELITRGWAPRPD